jgi:hydroxyacylglutathione hydrolase
MSVTITRIPAGPLETNAYLVIDDATNDAIVVDAPPDSLNLIAQAARENGANVKALVITHGHWDHIGDVAAIARTFGVPVWAHELVVDRIAQPGGGFPVQIEPGSVDATLADGDTVSVGETTFDVLHLPGHDVGHIALVNTENDLFLGGDILFPGGHGRTDIPGSDQAVMNTSLVRLLELPDSLVVMNGHGLPTTIGSERPWIQAIASA